MTLDVEITDDGITIDGEAMTYEEAVFLYPWVEKYIQHLKP